MRILVLLLMVSLSGCFFEPGMKMESAPVTKHSIEAAREIKPCFVPIDVQLIRDLSKQHKAYSVDRFDILNIYVWGHNEFAGPMGQAPSEQGVNSALSPSLSPSGFLVDVHGNIFYPLVGYIHVAQKTANQIRNDLMRRLKKYIRNPQVDVRVVGFRSKKIYVMGEVLRPSIQPLTDAPMSIADAIHLAGGLVHDAADPSHIFVIRGDYARPTVFWLDAHSPTRMLLAENFYLEAHDVLYISTASLTRFNRAISQILPTVQSIWYTKNLIDPNPIT